MRPGLFEVCHTELTVPEQSLSCLFVRSFEGVQEAFSEREVIDMAEMEDSLCVRARVE